MANLDLIAQSLQTGFVPVAGRTKPLPSLGVMIVFHGKPWAMFRLRFLSFASFLGPTGHVQLRAARQQRNLALQAGVTRPPFLIERSDAARLRWV